VISIDYDYLLIFQCLHAVQSYQFNYQIGQTAISCTYRGGGGVPVVLRLERCAALQTSKLWVQMGIMPLPRPYVPDMTGADTGQINARAHAF